MKGKTFHRIGLGIGIICVLLNLPLFVLTMRPLMGIWVIVGTLLIIISCRRLREYN